MAITYHIAPKNNKWPASQTHSKINGNMSAPYL
jgi:hypothetical protein